MTVDPQQALVVGADFGALSGRALVVRVVDGAELGSAVDSYPHAVVDDVLPGTGQKLPPGWALQVPEHYREVFRHAIPAAVEAAGADLADVVGIATYFTLVQLWRHRAVQGQADPMEPWVEGANVWELTGRYTPIACSAGYKGIRQEGKGPTQDLLAAVNPDFAGAADHGVLEPGAGAGVGDPCSGPRGRLSGCARRRDGSFGERRLHQTMPMSPPIASCTRGTHCGMTTSAAGRRRELPCRAGAQGGHRQPHSRKEEMGESRAGDEVEAGAADDERVNA